MTKKEFTPVTPSREATPYNSGAITSAYQLPSGFVVGYCPTTREWLKWDAQGKINGSFARTRKAAAALDETIRYFQLS